ncbi:CbiX/SirB N-terminal domain-containing protein [Candidatus Mycalebacterium sp.]
MPDTQTNAKTKRALILVDHGSAVAEANSVLAEVTREIRERGAGFDIVEYCHMEIASPTMEEAFQKCAELGAGEVVVHPYFLVPGRHSGFDIPAMAKKVAKKFPNLKHTVTEPLGLHEKIVDVVLERVSGEK